MLAFESLENIIKKIKNKEVSSKEVFDYFLKRIDKYDDKLSSFNYINKNFIDKTDSFLAWVPIGVKDVYAEAWIPTTWSSLMLKDFVPDYDSSIIQALNNAWMNSIWKLNMDEFAMWSSWENSVFKATKNPWDLSRVPWWSSSWCAASVAAWLCSASLWTDTWWSLRQPASLCWLVWFKPSYWRNSRFGIFPMASSFDCPWTITRTVKDAWILYNLMNSYDEKDNTTILWKHIIDEKIWEKESLKWFKIWIPKEYFEEGLDDGVKNVVNDAIEKIKDLWAEIIEVSLPTTKYAISAYYIIVPAEVSTNLARLDWIRYWYVSNSIHNNLEEFYINNRGEWLWIEPKRRSILWTYVLSAWFYDSYYLKASKVRTLIIDEFKNIFDKVDLLACPVSPSVAWKIWERKNDLLKMYLADSYTIPSSLAWLPAISIPCWFAKSEDEDKKELPVWLQIIWPLKWEEKIFELANIYEKFTPWKKTMIPKWFED